MGCREGSGVARNTPKTYEHTVMDSSSAHSLLAHARNHLADVNRRPFRAAQCHDERAVVARQMRQALLAHVLTHTAQYAKDPVL